jgi:hypothetical protein
VLTERKVRALREDAAMALALLEARADIPAGDEGDDLPEVRAARRDRLRVAVDVLTSVLVG